MKTLHSSLAGLLLATSALAAPHIALAQQAPAAQDAAAPAAAIEADTVDEIVVLGRYIPEPMRETSEVAAFLGEEDLKRQGDDNAAGALTRMTGLSLVGGKFVYVRGLGERYSAALLNGSPLPSPEPLQRVVPLDLFPTNILAGTRVQKSYSTNYPGEFGGGVIDLQTISVPTEPFLNVGFSVGANSETTLKDGLTYYGSDTDFLGYDDGTRDTPGKLDLALATGKRVSAGNFTDAELQRIAWSFVNAPLNLLQKTSNVPNDFSFDISGGRAFDMGWGTLGFVAVGGFDTSWRNRAGLQQEGLVQDGVMEARTSYDYMSTQNDIVVNGLFSGAVQWADNEVKWTNLYIHSTTKEARSRAGFDDAAGRDVRDDYTEWFERSLISAQLAGEHKFGDLEVDWRGAFAKTTRDAPYEKGIRYRLVDGVYYHDASQEQNYTRFSEVEDKVLSGGVDFKYTLPLSSERDAVFSGGLYYSDNDRHAESREFRLLALDGSLPAEVQKERVDFLLSDYNIGPGGLSLRETTGAEGAAAYEAALTVKAGYVQADVEVIPLVRAAIGVRYEDAEQSVVPRDLFGGAPPFAPEPLENAYWLPAGTVTWNFYEDMQLRFGASKTIARPQFRELAPQQYLDPDSDRVFIGNPYLMDTELLNFDARYEWYFDRGQVITLGAFYKDIDRPIEAVINESGSTVQQTYLNAPKATLYGVEVEAKKVFEPFMDGPFFGTKRWLVQANYTYSKSEVKVDPDDVVFPLAGGGSPRPASELVRDGDRLQGQSKHLANLQFGWEDDQAQSQATLLVGYASDRITARGRPGQPDLVQDPGVMLDFTYRKGFTVRDYDLTFGIEARNLLDEDFVESQKLGGGEVFNNTYAIGRSLSMSLSARF